MNEGVPLPPPPPPPSPDFCSFLVDLTLLCPRSSFGITLVLIWLGGVGTFMGRCSVMEMRATQGK